MNRPQQQLVEVPRAIKRSATIRALPHKIFITDENESLGSQDQLEKDRQDALSALYNAMHQTVDVKKEDSAEDKTNAHNSSIECHQENTQTELYIYPPTSKPKFKLRMEDANLTTPNTQETNPE